MKAKSAIFPRNRKDPTGVDKLERGAMGEVKKRIRQLRKEAEALLKQIPSMRVNKYQFLIDPGELTRLLDRFGDVVDELMIGRESGGWLFAKYARTAYQRGTAQEHANLSQQSELYEAGERELRQVLMSDAYRKRLGLTQARVFEEMKGLSADAKRELGRVISDGVGRGLSPRDIAKKIADRLGVVRSRANLIARTEVGQALRRARWEEADEARDKYKIETKLLHLSALSPTTRETHAARNGRLFTREEVEEWYSVDGNFCNCKCAQTAVLVDDSGLPISDTVRAKIQKERAGV